MLLFHVLNVKFCVFCIFRKTFCGECGSEYFVKGKWVKCPVKEATKTGIIIIIIHVHAFSLNIVSIIMKHSLGVNKNEHNKNLMKNEICV